MTNVLYRMHSAFAPDCRRRATAADSQRVDSDSSSILDRADHWHSDVTQMSGNENFEQMNFKSLFFKSRLSAAAARAAMAAA